MPYEIWEHTADVGVSACGESLEESFENTAKGMFSIMTNIEKVGNIEKIRFTIEEDEIDALLVSFLTKLLEIRDVYSLFLSEFEVKISRNDVWHLDAKVGGEEINPEKHELKVEVKAVTYHMLEVDIENKKCRVLFDI